ncbi:MAG: sigma-70 family RNA polymerase sigma factor [Pseudobacter sp.]|uniref:sigma-70 family RNA polymerase sigma factor n=1 Tax=Pseudobacter sp. TaxID=2045420 RepID=UPI003F7CEA31
MPDKNDPPEARQLNEDMIYLHDQFSESQIFSLIKKQVPRKIAEDIVYKALLAIRLRAREYESKEHLRNYFFKSVNNGYKDHIKKSLQLPIDVVDIDNYEDTQNTRLLLFNGVRTAREAIEWLLLHVTKSDRRILRLYYLEGKTLDEIAEIIGTTKGSVKSQKSTAIKKLKIKFPRLTEELLLFILGAFLV